MSLSSRYNNIIRYKRYNNSIIIIDTCPLQRTQVLLSSVKRKSTGRCNTEANAHSSGSGIGMTGEFVFYTTFGTERLTCEVSMPSSGYVWEEDLQASTILRGGNVLQRTCFFFFFVFYLYFVVPMGIFHMGNSGLFPRAKPIATELLYPTLVNY